MGIQCKDNNAEIIVITLTQILRNNKQIISTYLEILFNLQTIENCVWQIIISK